MFAAFLWERSAYVKRNCFFSFLSGMVADVRFTSLRCGRADSNLTAKSRAISMLASTRKERINDTFLTLCCLLEDVQEGALAARHRHVARLTPSEHCLGTHDQHGRAGRARHHKRPGVIFENVGRPWVKRFLAGVVAKKNGSVLFKSNKNKSFWNENKKNLEKDRGHHKVEQIHSAHTTTTPLGPLLVCMFSDDS